MATASELGSTPAMQDLLDRGDVVTAEGKLMRGVECAPQLAAIEVREIGRRPAYPCVVSDVGYGSFKRLKGDNSEFVCLSFEDWACHQTRSSDER
jgi:hypothetical protein